ncbi:hypothetical protein AK812_SmicGene39981 [Symbiodinium microadriaticum]|uniref:Uncharacterized protein n=1 Tax=Symbiodinium microadriaticum TaxID=2951 RepID=A0A1Q9C9U6_SYMMI|nr:hypothetical protein AK812_SmicGene39981 [Symbiodinium microadriaticum]
MGEAAEELQAAEEEPQLGHRNSQKRVLFYASQAIANLFVPGDTLSLKALLMRNQTLTNRISFECASDAFGLSACEYSELLDVGNMMYANFYVNGLQFLVSLIIIYCLGKFTQMPAEKLQFDKRNASRLMMLYGGICKQGPWLSRLLHFVQGILLFGSWLMMVMGYCRGNLALTHYCSAYNTKCAYNKARNCQYYYVYCKPDSTLLPNCMTEEGRRAFSGRMDIRLLSEVHCVACGILEADFANTVGEDEFYLLDDSSRGTDGMLPYHRLVQHQVSHLHLGGQLRGLSWWGGDRRLRQWNFGGKIGP